jgi:hypothetical protein
MAQAGQRKKQISESDAQLIAAAKSYSTAVWKDGDWDSTPGAVEDSLESALQQAQKNAESPGWKRLIAEAEALARNERAKNIETVTRLAGRSAAREIESLLAAEEDFWERRYSPSREATMLYRYGKIVVNCLHGSLRVTGLPTKKKSDA